jgi:hypothetical protein
VRVRRPDTLASPAVAGLFERAFRAVGCTSPPLELKGFLRGNIGRNEWGAFVGSEGGVPKAVVVALLPTSPFMLSPQIPLAYNEGSKALARLLGVRVRKWILDNGFNDALAINVRHSAAVFGRVFAHFGKPSRFAEMISFQLR